MTPFDNTNTGGPGLVNKKPTMPGEAEVDKNVFGQAYCGAPCPEFDDVLIRSKPQFDIEVDPKKPTMRDITPKNRY